jgi:hypothetical protein
MSSIGLAVECIVHLFGSIVSIIIISVYCQVNRPVDSVTCGMFVIRQTCIQTKKCVRYEKNVCRWMTLI